jgi:endonuclease/exonuclease/phosphatase (EEP) superfamily protein YafD
MTKEYKILGNFATIRSLISVILIIGVALTIMTFWGRWWWGFELATHFRVQYIILFSLLAVVLMVKKQWMLSGIASICTMIHLLVILPGYLSPRDNTVKPSSEAIKILFSNIHAKNTHHHEILDLISKEGPDVVVLVEVNNTWLKWLKPLGKTYPHSQTAKGKHYERIVLFSQLPILSSREKYFGSHHVPALIATLDFKNQPLTIYTSHLTSPISPGHAEARNETLKLLAQEIQLTKEPAVLIGDLNISPWSPYFYDLVRTSGLKDSRDGFGIQASWPTVAPPFLIPLDHCLVHPSIQVLDRRLGPNIGSDHYPVLLQLALSKASQVGLTAVH